jgi:hypothetical protein
MRLSTIELNVHARTLQQLKGVYRSLAESFARSRLLFKYYYINTLKFIYIHNFAIL